MLTEPDLLALLDRMEFAMITPNQLRFLLLVKSSCPEKPMENPSAIASHMMVSATSVTDISRHFRKLKLITRKRDHLDDRKIIYGITTAGEDFIAAIITGQNIDAIA
jgi:DNA-binding MarR family transcriptional regulator